MKVFTLIGDSARQQSGFLAEHGLSLYFERGDKRILFDTGASDSFIYNATLLGVDLSKVNICVITHAHSDHTGGLKYFLSLNDNAKVYMKSGAAGDFYIKRSLKLYKSGINPEIFKTYADRIEFIEKDVEIADGVYVATIDKYRHYPHFTSLMYEKQDGEFKKDKLAHELFVAVKHENGAVVMTGCSHQGVINMLMTANEKFGNIKGVIGGLHLDGRKRFGMMRKKEPGIELNAIAKYINDNKIKNVYIGHCIGETAQERLELFARAHKLYSGDVIDI